MAGEDTEDVNSSPTEWSLWEELKYRMQSAFSVLSGESVAVGLEAYQDMMLSHSIALDDLDAAIWRDIEYELAELPAEERTPDREKQIIDSVYKSRGMETPELERRVDIEPER